MRPASTAQRSGAAGRISSQFALSILSHLRRSQGILLHIPRPQPDPARRDAFATLFSVLRRASLQLLHLLDRVAIPRVTYIMIPRVKPDPAQDLFELYGLNDIAESVARVHKNGEKNALRKTYKGQIKKLGISGKFDVKVNPEAESRGGLMALVFQPEDEWMMQNYSNKGIQNGMSDAARACLSKAATMAKGSIPQSRWDSSVLGDMDPAAPKKPPVPATSTAKIPTGGPVGAAARTATNSRPKQADKADVARPKRNIKKRHYEDSSFEGYGEGYVDDDLADPGYSTAEGDERGQKRRKKVCDMLNQALIMTLFANLMQAAANSYTSVGPIRHNSYGPGMVGV